MGNAPEAIGVGAEERLEAGTQDGRGRAGRRGGERSVAGGESADERGQGGGRETGAQGGGGDVLGNLGLDFLLEHGTADCRSHGAAKAAHRDDEAGHLRWATISTRAAGTKRGDRPAQCSAGPRIAG